MGPHMIDKEDVAVSSHAGEEKKGRESGKKKELGRVIKP